MGTLVRQGGNRQFPSTYKIVAGEMPKFMRFQSLTLLIDIIIYFIVKFKVFDGGVNAILFFVAVGCWFLGTLSLNQDWKLGKISHRNFMIISHGTLLFVASMPYGI